MTIDELREWIKDEIVLHEGDVADWQWRQKGLTAEAKSLGLSDADFNRLVNQVSLNVQPDFGKISAIRSSILTMARQRRGKLTTVDIESMVNQAEPARLSRAFVTEKWIPALLQTLPVEPEVGSSPPPPPVPVQPVTEPGRPTGETPDSMRRKVIESLDDFKGRIPAPAIRSLFRTINYDETELAVAIWNYLQIHQYVADQEPTGDTLRDKLVSTDWQSRPTPTSISEPSPVNSFTYESPAPVVRSFTATPARVHQGQPVTLAWEVDNLLAVTIDDLGEGLSPNNRGWVKPAKTTDYTLFDANNNPLSTVRVEVIPHDRSGVYGVLFAMVLLAIIYWFIKSSNSKSSETRPKSKTEQTTSRQEQPPAVSAVSQPEKTDKREANTASDTTTQTAGPPVAIVETPQREESKVNTKPANEATDLPELEARTTTPNDARQGKYAEAFGDKPYDKVELGTDERGWRRARVNGRWGYVNEADEWVINPDYEAVTPFRGNTASVFLNGRLMTINRAGEQVRN